MTLNPSPDMPILDSSSSTANKDMMSKMWTNGDTDTHFEASTTDSF